MCAPLVRVPEKANKAVFLPYSYVLQTKSMAFYELADFSPKTDSDKEPH